MKAGTIVILVVGVAAVGVGVVVFLGHRSSVKAAAIKKQASSGSGINAGDVVSFFKGAVPVVQGIVEYFND